MTLCFCRREDNSFRTRRRPRNKPPRKKKVYPCLLLFPGSEAKEESTKETKNSSFWDFSVCALKFMPKSCIPLKYWIMCRRCVQSFLLGLFCHKEHLCRAQYISGLLWWAIHQSFPIMFLIGLLFISASSSLVCVPSSLMSSTGAGVSFTPGANSPKSLRILSLCFLAYF